AFSVATARRPDILIVDEALSVGDAYFQHKSFGRIRDFRRSGTTLLIVSHDRQAIQTICDRAVLLNHGQLALADAPEEVMDFDDAMIAEREQSTIRKERLADNSIPTISDKGELRIAGVAMLNQEGKRVDLIETAAPIPLQVTLK